MESESTSFTMSPSVEKKNPRILQVFSRYKSYGGEEGSVYRISDILQQDFDTGFFVYSSANQYAPGLLNQAIGVAKSFHNWSAIKLLKKYEMLGHYNCWLIHNVFPALSPAVYELAFKMGIPVIQYLHNYRMGCVNGFFMNHGEPCQRCMDGNFLAAFTTACWHESHIQSGIMGAITKRTRMLGLFERVTHWIAISAAQKEEHVRMGISEEKISVIPHFLEAKDDAPPYPEQGDVLFVGRLSPEKGVECLLKAWMKVQESGRTLWIVGEGSEKEKLEQMSLSLGLRNVRFTGFLNHEAMADIWARSSCSLVPSIWKEPFGMVVLEAWAKARPVVAHRIGALPELIHHEKNGLLVPPHDPGAMADAILSILNNPEKSREMGRLGLERLKTEYSVAEWRKKSRKLFESIKM